MARILYPLSKIAPCRDTAPVVTTSRHVAEPVRTQTNRVLPGPGRPPRPRSKSRSRSLNEVRRLRRATPENPGKADTRRVGCQPWLALPGRTRCPRRSGPTLEILERATLARRRRRPSKILEFFTSPAAVDGVRTAAGSRISSDPRPPQASCPASCPCERPARVSGPVGRVPGFRAVRRALRGSSPGTRVPCGAPRRSDAPSLSLSLTNGRLWHFENGHVTESTCTDMHPSPFSESLSEQVDCERRFG